MHGRAKTQLLFHSAVIGAIALAATGARAANAPLVATDVPAGPTGIELIGTSRLGCGQGTALWTATTGGTQCAFDSATRGARITARQEVGAGSLEAYATVVHATSGALTPDQLLTAPENRFAEATDFLLVGVKGSALDGRLRLTGELARTTRTVDGLVGRDWFLADRTSDGGTSASLRLDAKLVSTPRFSWSLAGEYRSVSEDYSVGRAAGLSRYFAMPGTRLALSTAAKVGAARMTAGIEQRRTPHGDSLTRKAGVDVDGVSLRWVSRDTSLTPLEGSSLLDSRGRSDAAYLDLDVGMLVASLLPSLDRLPFVVPATVNFSYRSGNTANRYSTATEQYSRSSLGIDAGWETPLGETAVGYWRDERIGLTADASSRSTEMVQLSHMVRRGNWRFGLDASLTRSSGEGSDGYDDRSLSFGQSVAYSAPGGPEFRLQLGRDQAVLRMADDSYASTDSYSRITASLDLSRYLQKRFERDDLRLTVDYRRALERTNSEMTLHDELVERWVDGDRREGLLMSFGMKL